ncbi:MAG TPA: DUF971 domain-containing protein [Candidatus Manganitrophaceae bacterium]|nr:DUF971 domain-containing protein [Candidatus Manganitrophaceae bacterium]
MISKEAAPVEIAKLGEKGIRISWSDGHQGIYQHLYLRENCRCASCVQEWSGEKLIRAENIPQDITPAAIQAVGNYAISIRWSDGHDTGIYPFDFLKEICPCEECLSRLKEP